MALSENRKLLLNGLDLFGVEKEAMTIILLLLKTDEQAEMMMDFMANNLSAQQGQLLMEAVKIAEQTTK